MKQLKCEMCGGTELLKEDGVFVCQTCGTKYSVEEAKKMMVEIDGAVVVKNVAQLENLLNLAHSSFDSKNYSQAEEFCNQVIAIDDKNYDAWKLKGEAINYQINTDNQRILEAYNCIMTAYEVLDEEQKYEKKAEIFLLLKTCFEEEVNFWLNQFEANRPTATALTRAKNAYIDSYTKMKSAIEKLGLEELEESYLTYFDNYYIKKCNEICVSAWKTTVGYNYYREYFSTYGSTWIVNNLNNIDPRTDDYRPTKNIFQTFIKESDNLIKLEDFALRRVNYNTNINIVKKICSNIIFIQEKVIAGHCFQIDCAAASNWDTQKTVGWRRTGLTNSAKEIRKKEIEKYEQMKKSFPEELKKQRMQKYLEEHPEEKKQLDDIEKQIRDIENKIAPKINELTKERDKKLPAEVEVDKQTAVIRDLKIQRSKCGIFKSKEKKAITERIDTVEQPKLERLKQQADNEKKMHIEKINQQIKAVQSEGKELRDEADRLKEPMNEFVAEIETEI